MPTSEHKDVVKYRTENGIVVPEDVLTKTVEVYLAKPSNAFRYTVYASMLLIVGFCTWAALTTVPVVVKSTGSLRPSTDLQVFRSPRSAVVQSLFIRENDLVRAGDTLLTLQHEHELAQKELLSIEMRQHEQDVHDLELMLGALPDSVDQQINYDRQRFLRPSSIAQMLVTAKDLELLYSQLSAIRKNEERVRNLVNREFATREELETLQQDRRQLEVQILQYLLEKRQLWSGQLFESTRILTKIRQERAAIDKRISQAVLVANIDGHITENTVEKEGLFVQEGAILFSITPEQELVAELYVAPRDIGHIKVGHQAQLHFETFSYSEWGAAEGHVVQIGTDIQFEPNSQRTYYKVVCKLVRSELTYKRNETATTVALKKGLPLQANITIAEKTIFEMIYNRTVDYLQL